MTSKRNKAIIKRAATYLTFIFLALMTGLTDPYMTYQDMEPERWLDVTIKMKIDPQWGLVGWNDDQQMVSMMFGQPFTATINTILQKEDLDNLITLLGDGKYSGDGPPISITISTDDSVLEYAFAKFQQLGIGWSGDGNVIITQKTWNK
jgi:hypothetical protein